jgi:acyl-coenzyme A thioesterase PaaI-like protein
MHLPTLLTKARSSGFTRWWLNHALSWLIPFNRPHGFKVTPLPEGGIRVSIPNWRVNRNHIKGIHACALATAAEMCSGLSLLERLDPKKYRLIMRTLHMAYHYQAKQPAHATCVPTAAEIEEKVVGPLRSADSVDHTSVVELHDRSGNHLATGTVTWQVKEWSKVRTKV